MKWENMITCSIAEKYISALKENASGDKLQRVLLFGGVAKEGQGTDLDIIVEVQEETFLEFCRECIGALDGYHPILKVMLPMASMYWDYESPQLHRLKNALSAIGVDSSEVRDKLNSILRDEYVDMLCLPVGWEDPGYADGLLARAFGFKKDPDMLRNIQNSAVPM